MLTSLSEHIANVYPSSLDLLIPCEYNRLIKKRGKGSELYPQNPRKVARKTQQNLPALASRSTEEAGKSRQETPSEAGELDLNSVKIKLSPSVEAATLARDRNVQTDNQPGEEFTSTQTEKPGHTVTDPYAALMRLADTSEQHHQLSENQRSTLSSIAGQSHPTMKRHHAEEQEYPRKGMAIPTIGHRQGLGPENINNNQNENSNNNNGANNDKSRYTAPTRWAAGANTFGDAPGDPQMSFSANQLLSHLPPISDLKTGGKDLDTATPLSSQSSNNLPSISTTPNLPGSPDPGSLPNNNTSNVNLDALSRNAPAPPKIPSVSTTPNNGTDTPLWNTIKSPFNASEIISSMFEKTSNTITTPPTPKPYNTVNNAESDNKRGSGSNSWVDKNKTYPVLDPIVHEIDFMPPQLMSEFLEIYFTNNTYTVAPILRRCSILSYEKPRKCSPVLLYSILYVSAHACNHPLMTSAPDFKARLTSKLLDRLMSYMRPWKNDNSHEYDLDEIIAYINVGIVSSASEFKGSSLRWWAIAWCMARVLKLNKEIPSLEEEAREERRRVWWTLFMIDRHLGLCYNRPCTLLDSESLELFFPISMEIWDSDSLLYPPEDDRNRRRGPQCKVIEVGLFGMYLPLMTLLGGIIDIHFLAMSPVLSGKEHVLKLLRESYRHRLSAFQFSLEEYYSQMSGPPNTLLQSWREYCQCFIQVFYILLEGFWDPTEMLDDIDVLLNDTRFTRCLANSIQASKHVQKILVLDPDLQVIPFFFGVQLLQAGFIPFCMSERYGSHTSTDVAQACEIFIRAHEVCIVTLSTQYQVHFRFIMRGVIRDMKHATVSVNDRIDSTRRRREIMSMYRWNAGGTGLAI